MRAVYFVDFIFDVVGKRRNFSGKGGRKGSGVIFIVEK